MIKYSGKKMGAGIVPVALMKGSLLFLFGKEKSDIFLAKLVLLLSKKFTDLEEIMKFIEEASLDLKN